jgi:glutamate-5-semialdehyde dehydrogenase
MLKTLEKNGEDVATLMRRLGEQARAAAHPLAIASSAAKDAALEAMAAAILRREEDILAANVVDVENGRKAGLAASFLDRLKLTPDRIRAMADGIRAIAALTDPVGDVIA